jgi:hypothetical protein
MEVVERTGAALQFDRVAVYNTPSAPSSATVTLDTTDAVVGVELVCYFNHATEPTWPAGITAVGQWNNAALNVVRFVYQSPTDISAQILSDYTGTGASWTLIRKLANTTRNSTATLAADPDLQFAMDANKVYLIRGQVNGVTGATPDFKYRITGPGSPVRMRIVRQHIIGGGGTAPANSIATAFDSADVVFLATGTQALSITFEAFVETGASAGTFAIEWAQNTSNAADTTVNASYLEYSVS